MKPLRITITWDRLRQGEFPKEELEGCSPSMDIITEKLSPLKEKITLIDSIPDDEEEADIAFEIGSLIGTITTNRINGCK